nr:MAG TPA: hypothetical protein [Caudoviricetes sp.]
MTKEMNDTVVWAFRKSPVQPYIDLSKVSDYLLCRALDDSYSHIPLIAIKTGEIHDLDGTIHPVFSNGRLLAQKLSANGFSNTDVLRLTEHGEDILYQMKKDTHLLEQQTQAIRYAKLSFIATIIIGIITTLLTGVPLIWRCLFP